MLVRASRPPMLAFVLPGLGAGGSEHIVSLLCNHFAAQGWVIALIVFEEPSAPSYYAYHPDVRIIRLGMKSRRRSAATGALAMLRRRRLLKRALQEVRPELVVSFLTRTNILSLLAARTLGIPVIVSERNNPALQAVGPVWSRLRRMTYPRAAGLITMTQGAMDWFQAAMDVKGWVIPNPVPPAVMGAEARPGGRTIGAVGRLVPQKGFDLLLDAFARVAGRIPDWTLTIWGEGPERGALERQCAHLGLTERVSLPGVTEKPGEWVPQSDLFVLSSRFEGWGIVVGEAMGAGLPVISFDCQWGPAEMIEHGKSGLLVPVGEVAALGEAIAALCADEARRQALGAGARERMAQFGHDQVLARWQSVIASVLDHHRVRAGS
ncbi:glycosyltransferase family 4 protein [Sphingobium sp. JS3065]|jgi:glycosyltransferase involved in cell wall biosynthesis|uniref:glycosyltransferase family 4 protein n=1 Tax=Sphingobium sp. JS3065 TaxID=2970925 RepID=UPI00226460D4|nr:glycosyltransferase family 4 protein [Sphingobium sp. JS3065]UZW54537.1 glycosyltransferase family 4 protein [Sphingobium sp. JS3065]